MIKNFEQANISTRIKKVSETMPERKFPKSPITTIANNRHSAIFISLVKRDLRIAMEKNRERSEDTAKISS